MALKIFVWISYDAPADVQTFAVALAETEEEARQVILRDAEDWENTEYLASKIAGSANKVFDKSAGIHL